MVLEAYTGGDDGDDTRRYRSGAIWTAFVPAEKATGADLRAVTPADTEMGAGFLIGVEPSHGEVKGAQVFLPVDVVAGYSSPDRRTQLDAVTAGLLSVVGEVAALGPRAIDERYIFPEK
jgi:hypothetical protein